jgi:predicted nucleic acid-binding Zn ribbon protein
VSGLPERLGKEIRRELTRFEPAGAIAEIVELWPSAVGETIARNAWPARIARDGTLHVATSSSAWAFELGLLERKIRGRLEAALGSRLTRLRFAPGRLPEPAVETPNDRSVRGSRPTLDDWRTAARLAATIEDENLRKIVAKAAASSLAAALGRPPGLVD